MVRVCVRNVRRVHDVHVHNIRHVRDDDVHVCNIRCVIIIFNFIRLYAQDLLK